MIKRKNKIMALLVAASSIMTLVPAMADTSRLDTKDGNITNAIAYKDGKYVYQGYKSNDDDDAIYYNDGNKDKALDDVEDADLNTTYEDKYAFANDGSSQYLIDLTNGNVTDDDTPLDDADTAATKLQTKLKKTDRYGDNLSLDATNAFNNGISIDDNQLVTIPGSKFGDSWYAYDVTTSTSDSQKYLAQYREDTNHVKTGHLYGFTNDSGKYIDASSTANIYAYSTKQGKMVKIKDYSNSYDDKDSDSGLLATLIQQPVALTQDKDYIYALVTVAITDTATNAIPTGETTTSASIYVDGASGNPATTTIRTYIQKISKAQDGQKDDAYLPKTVESYEVGNKNDEYDCGDASDAYDAILATINDANSVSNLISVKQKDVLGRVDDNGIAKPLFTVNNGNLVAIKANDDEIDAVTLKFKKDKVKFDKILPGYKTADATTTSASAVNFDKNTKVDAYLIEKDSDDSVDIDVDSANDAYKAYDIDIDGNVWVVTDGKIYKYKDGGDMTKVYTCDSSLDSISVYDENNLIVWENDGDVYTTINEGKSETPAPTTPSKVGWDQLADGSWNFYDATGTKIVNNWANVGGVWYYLDANGTMVTGWQYVNGAWYYLNPVSDGTKGAMKTGWIYDNGNWYYLNSSGAMATGWQYVNGAWYYLNSVSNGTMGAMKTGWIYDNGNWYYLYSNGAMAANTTIEGYRLSSSGALI